MIMEARLRWRREGLCFLGGDVSGGVEFLSDSGRVFFRRSLS